MNSFCYIALLLAVSVARTHCAQFSSSLNTDTLPTNEECGSLRPEQLYNLEKISDSDEFPWMARLGYNISNTIEYNQCLAVLISKRFLILPAHCLRHGTPATVKFGNCAEKCTVIRRIDKFIIHPGYSANKLDHDIALMRLQEPLRYVHYMRPICLPSADLKEEGYVAQHLMSAGIVRSSLDSNKRFLLVVDLNHCRQIFFRTELDDSLICANTCDNGSRLMSGSALMAVNATRNKANNYYFVGLLTFGMRECMDYTPDIFQRIDGYVDWIRVNVEWSNKPKYV